MKFFRFPFRPVLGILAGVSLLISGCGYTQKTTLPRGMKTIYVDTVRNEVPVDQVYAYHPGLEMMITNAILRRLEQDGNLRIVRSEDADVLLRASMVGFEQHGVRFNTLEGVEEFRLFIVLQMKLLDAKNNELIWEEPNFTGDAEYFVSAVRSIARGEAAERAVNRLARNVVDRIVEDW